MTEAKQTSAGTEVPAQLKSQYPGIGTCTQRITPIEVKGQGSPEEICLLRNEQD